MIPSDKEEKESDSSSSSSDSNRLPLSVVSDGFDPKLQTFFYRAKFRRQGRSKNIVQNVNHVHPHVLEVDSPEATQQSTDYPEDAGISSSHGTIRHPIRSEVPSGFSGIVEKPFFGKKTFMGTMVERFPSTQLVVASIITISGMITAFILFVCIRRIWLKRYEHKISIRENGLRRFNMEEIEKATMRFSKECLVGLGAFGKVYKGVFDEGAFLAVKRGHVDSYESLFKFKNDIFFPFFT